MYKTYLHINGKLRPSANNEFGRICNPSSGREIGEFSVASDSDLDEVLDLASRGFYVWREVSPYERGRVLRRAAAILRERAHLIAPFISCENGKTKKEALAEVDWASEYLDWFGEEARRLYGRVIPARGSDPRRQYTLLEPVGPVLAISPWNWPLVPLVRKISAALAAGCSVIAKPAEETPTAATFLADALIDAGLPPSAFSVVFGNPAHLTDRIIGSPIVRKISFTGSVSIGRQLATTAANYLKPIILELGGHAPVLIFDDCDVDIIMDDFIKYKFRTAGQVCSSPTRIFVHDPILDKFCNRIKSAVKFIRVGDFKRDDVDMGPLINKRRVEYIDTLVKDAIEKGANLLSGGRNIGSEGFFYEPTLLSNVSAEARIMHEEPFGPVIPISGFKNYTDAISKANNNRHALAAYVFTNDIRVTQKAIKDINCGNIGVNTFAISMAEAPFGGNFDSGYGREGGTEGVMEFLNTKFVAEASA
jgi:succinate-semialdehyde dehydrogenase/glutarate-semialdehyde dehydrogenase